MKKTDGIVWGLILLVLGSVLILGEFNIFNFSNLMEILWPAFIYVPGIMFHISAFSKEHRRPGFLVPGGILLTVGMTCQLGALFGNWDVIFPGFIIAPAVGLFELYYFGRRARGLLIPVGILTAVAVTLFFTVSFYELKWLTRKLLPLAMIIMGIGFIVKNRSARESHAEYQYHNYSHNDMSGNTYDHNTEGFNHASDDKNKAIDNNSSRSIDCNSNDSNANNTDENNWYEAK